MAITSGAGIFELGTQATVISDSSAIANGAFNAGTVTALVQTDNTWLGNAVLDVTLASVPAAGAEFYLYRRDMNIDGTNDASVPDANFKSTLVGSFKLDLVSTQQFVHYTGVPLEVDQEFYIENDTGVSTTGTTVVKITPKAPNSKA